MRIGRVFPTIFIASSVALGTPALGCTWPGSWLLTNRSRRFLLRSFSNNRGEATPQWEFLLDWDKKFDNASKDIRRSQTEREVRISRYSARMQPRIRYMHELIDRWHFQKPLWRHFSIRSVGRTLLLWSTHESRRILRDQKKTDFKLLALVMA